MAQYGGPWHGTSSSSAYLAATATPHRMRRWLWHSAYRSGPATAPRITKTQKNATRAYCASLPTMTERRSRRCMPKGCSPTRRRARPARCDHIDTAIDGRLALEKAVEGNEAAQGAAAPGAVAVAVRDGSSGVYRETESAQEGAK